MKRLLCIVSKMDAGGAETFLMKIYRNLDLNNYQMDFIVSDHGVYDEEIINKGGKIYYIPLRTEHFFKSMNAIKKIVKENNYSSVLKMTQTPIAYFDLLAAKMGGAKLLASRSCNSFSDDGKLMRIINKLLRPFFNRISTVKIAPSDLAAEFLYGRKELEKSNIHYLPNAIDLSLYKYNEKDALLLRHELKLEGKTIYGHVGRFNQQKNHNFLIDVFDKIASKDPNAVLVLAGKGELESSIKKKVTDKKLDDRVYFLGLRNDVPKLLSIFDLMIFPSHYEGMPNVIIESQACGLHCVVSDTITKQANITGLVEYVSLDKTSQEWADICLKTNKSHSIETKKIEEAGYDINNLTKRFCDLLY